MKLANDLVSVSGKLPEKRLDAYFEFFFFLFHDYLHLQIDTQGINTTKEHIWNMY